MVRPPFKQLYELLQLLQSLGHFTVATVAGNLLPIKHGMLWSGSK